MQGQTELVQSLQGEAAEHLDQKRAHPEDSAVDNFLTAFSGLNHQEGADPWNAAGLPGGGCSAPGSGAPPGHAAGPAHGQPGLPAGHGRRVPRAQQHPTQRAHQVPPGVGACPSSLALLPWSASCGCGPSFTADHCCPCVSFPAIAPQGCQPWQMCSAGTAASSTLSLPASPSCKNLCCACSRHAVWTVLVQQARHASTGALQAVHEVIEMSDNQRRAVMAALEAGAGRTLAEPWSPPMAEADLAPWTPSSPSVPDLGLGSAKGGSGSALQTPLLSEPVPR